MNLSIFVDRTNSTRSVKILGLELFCPAKALSFENSNAGRHTSRGMCGFPQLYQNLGEMLTFTWLIFSTVRDTVAATEGRDCATCGRGHATFGRTQKRSDVVGYILHFRSCLLYVVYTSSIFKLDTIHPISEAIL